jgi:lipoprotein-releasing system permease protein
MYKYLLCWRYLRTRYIALASVVSVMLGVATMIVVNSVMAGFSDKMRDRIHGIMADIVVEGMSFDGFYNWEEVVARIERAGGDRILATAPTMEIFGLLKHKYRSEPIYRQVQIIGIKPADRAKTGDFADFLIDENGKKIAPTFDIPDRLKRRPTAPVTANGDTPAGPDADFQNMIDALNHEEAPSEYGAIVGYALATYRRKGLHTDDYLLTLGSQIALIYPQAGTRPKPGMDRYTVVGLFKSGMSEYDSTHVYVPIERLQQMRLLVDPATGRGAVNQIQVKAAAGTDLTRLAEELQVALDRLHPMRYRVTTWEERQGALLSAVAIEQSILNMLLFFIIAVAGFGILAIFFMIVVEKTRDIGVLKALGASTGGIRNIFLGYGMLLGMVGSGVGMAAGLLFVRYINEIESLLSKVTGRKVFDDSIYYFNEIPTLVEPMTVFWIVGGALFIAAAASVWPAQRAAKLHPVRALRFE